MFRRRVFTTGVFLIIFLLTLTVILQKAKAQTALCLEFQDTNTETIRSVNPRTGHINSHRSELHTDIRWSNNKRYGILIGSTPEYSNNIYFISGSIEHQVILEENVISIGFDWSPDSKWLAYYIITPQKKGFEYSVSIVNTNTKKKQSVFNFLSDEMPAVEQEDIFNTFGWSPDGRYIAFSSVDVSSLNVKLHFWSASSGLTTLSINHFNADSKDTLVPRVHWSNKDHRLAVVVSNGIQKQFIIISPEKGIEAKTLLPNDIFLGYWYAFYYPRIMWSPNERYIAFRYFQHQSLNLLVLSVDETELIPIGNVQDAPNSGDLDPTLNFDAFWTGDSKSFVFWRRVANERSWWNEIAVFHSDSHYVETRISRIKDYRYFYDGLAIVQDHDNSSDINLVRNDGTHLISIVDNAETLYPPAPYYKRPSPIGLLDSGAISVLWAKQNKTYITWINRDGSGRHEIETGFKSFLSANWQGKWLAIVGYKPDQSMAIVVVDTRTGTQYQLYDPLPRIIGAADWNFSIAPNGQRATVVIAGEHDKREMYLISLARNTVIPTYPDAKWIYPGVWSPDSTQVAYFFFDTMEKLAVLNVETLELKTFNQLGDISGYSLKWVKCS